MNKHGIEVGMVVYIEPIGNGARYSRGIREERVAKVGRKYFYTSPDGDPNWNVTQFRLKDFLDERNGYSSNFKAYRSRQEIEDKHEMSRLYTELRERFTSHSHTGRLPLDKLRRIMAIVREGEE